MGRTRRLLIDFRWVIVRAVTWIGGTVFLAVQGRWVSAAIVFVVVGAYFWIWGTTLLLIWRRDRRRERDRTQGA